MEIQQVDHLVLTVLDIDASCEFYHQVLGMDIVEFGEGRKALAFGLQKINLHRYGEELEPHAAHPAPGTADMCFLTSVPLDDFVRRCRENNVEIVEGPVERTGAQGPILSVYLRDPDGNLIEVANPLY